jgi:MFS family permease
MTNTRKAAMQFIILMGFVSLFADITYEGGRSATGPYLAMLGASAAVVGFASGLGEFLGYGLRLVSGFLADKTRGYWALTFFGYGLIFAVPFLALTHHWPLAIFLIIAERIGKAIRSPARDAILSYATKEVGRGWGFAVHEAMDQIGAIIGPLLISFVFVLKGGYRQGFGILWVPAVFAMAALLIARKRAVMPHLLETGPKENLVGRKQEKLSKIFWLYAFFTFFCVAGFANFQIIAYHFKVKSIVPDMQIPILYAAAMAVDGGAALLIGRLYDKIGFKALIALPILTIPIPFFVFSSVFKFVVIGILLWGVVMGIHETIMRAAIADLTSIDKRGMGYGIFNAIYGASFFIGSALMGVLYDFSLSFITVFVVISQLLALPFFFLLQKSSSAATK